jgi:large subunit ribosomal protein L18
MKPKILTPRKRRHARIRAKVFGASTRPRLSIFRSSKHVWAQIIDDQKGATLAAASDVIKSNIKYQKSKMSKTERAMQTGNALAKMALVLGVREVVFDRGGYKYHGRIKALAEGVRAGGLKF